MNVQEIDFIEEGMCMKSLTKMPIIGENLIKNVVPYEKLKSVDLDIKATSIEPIIKEGNFIGLRFKVSNFGESQSDKIPTQISPMKDTNRLERSIKFIPPEEMLHRQGEIPPEISKKLNEHPEWPNYYKDFTYQLYNPSNIAHKIRSIIRERSNIGDKELRNLLVERNICKTTTTGSIGASIVVLREVTREIREEGRSDFRKYIWIGKQI